jgi:uncharacterized protein YeaO (DUF488 family)
MKIATQRIYDDSQLSGYRVLVDRIWPRGISKEEAKLDGWWKDIAPSSKLRKWFSHDAGKWKEFQKKYVHELESNKELLKQLRAEASASKKQLILLYGAKDENHNQALVLKDYLSQLSK